MESTSNRTGETESSPRNRVSCINENNRTIRRSPSKCDDSPERMKIKQKYSKDENVTVTNGTSAISHVSEYGGPKMRGNTNILGQSNGEDNSPEREKTILRDKPTDGDVFGTRDFQGTLCGSPAYAAPEIIARKRYGPKVDVWSM